MHTQQRNDTAECGTPSANPRQATAPHVSPNHDRPDITPETRPPPGVVPGQLPQAYYGGGAPFYPPQQASGPPPQASGGVVAPPQQQAEQQNHVYK
ncbi:rhodopsin family protein [Aspergillus luchuensis]|uniref:Rhodopsin family protein n=1 Tax=Aspergillus kawachii TaxID=1069201 RepID=A0A146FNN2_ASPKA|nr:rhodopsin family protein [Aspergillus luchuensis]